MKNIELMKKLKIHDYAREKLKVHSIKDGTIETIDSFNGRKVHIFSKVFKITSVPDYKTLGDDEKEEWNKKIRNLVSSMKTKVSLSFKTVNYNTKINYWQSYREVMSNKTVSSGGVGGFIEDMTGFSLGSKVENTTSSELRLFDDLKEYAEENIYNSLLLDIRREYYITVPYYLFEEYKGKPIDREKLTKSKKKLAEFCDRNELKPYFEEYFKQSQKEVHDFQQKNLMKSFYENVSKIIKKSGIETKELEDEELATLLNSRFYPTIYTQLNGKDLYLSIHDFIQIAGEHRNSFNRLHNFFDFKQKSKSNMCSYNNVWNSMIGVLRAPDYFEKDGMDFITEAHGDLEFYASFTPIASDHYVKEYDEELDQIDQLINQHQIEFAEYDEDLVTWRDKVDWEKRYIDKQKFYRLQSYVLVRDVNEKALVNTTNEILNKINSRGLWAKQISSENFQKDLRSASFQGLQNGKSNWDIAEDTLDHCFNFIHLDFDLPMNQGKIRNLGEVNKQVEVQQKIDEKRRLKENA